MPTIDFTGCVSTYWFVWSINGVGSIVGMAINMVVSYLLLKQLQSLPNGSTSAPKKGKSNFSKFRSQSPVTDMSTGFWGNDPSMGYGYNTS